MRRNLFIGVVTTASLFLLIGSASAANHVRVDRVSFVQPNAVCTVGVYITNDVAINGLVLPLEIRTREGGAYIKAGTWSRDHFGRMKASPLGDADDGGLWPGANITRRTFSVNDAATATCFTNNGMGWNTAAALPDYVSPDAILHATVSQGDPNIGELTDMEPGDDPAGTPSYRIICTVNEFVGLIIIDTTCVRPANHLVFTRQDGENTVPVLPTFEHGIIGVDKVAGLKAIETGVVPHDYALEQNYPNPFNAGTVIRFAQPVDGKVRIDVFNILGRKVKTLVNEFRSAGTHQADWDGRSDDGIEVATGVYFYRITTEGFTSTRKMVLLK